MKRILVIDDSTFILKTLQAVLKHEHFEVRAAQGGREAIKLLNTGFFPDLIITDIHMPDMNGIELIALLRQKNQLAVVPILILSADYSLKDDALIKELGIAEFMLKPILYDQLMQLVGQHLGMEQKAQEIIYF